MMWKYFPWYEVNINKNAPLTETWRLFHGDPSPGLWRRAKWLSEAPLEATFCLPAAPELTMDLCLCAVFRSVPLSGQSPDPDGKKEDEGAEGRWRRSVMHSQYNSTWCLVSQFEWFFFSPLHYYSNRQKNCVFIWVYHVFKMCSKFR